jgi:methylated-DNA-[protein]-cysteine S-methyltransferase
MGQLPGRSMDESAVIAAYPDKGYTGERKMQALASLATPIGPIGLAVSAAGLAQVNLSGPVAPDTSGGPADPALAAAIAQLTEYFAGERQVFDVPLDWSGMGGLRLRVLRALHAEVPYGKTVTYGELAAMAGAPDAARAVGGIMNSNPLPLIVPCHRVVASDGLGGFGGGLEMKRWLLTREGYLPPTLDWAFD